MYSPVRANLLILLLFLQACQKRESRSGTLVIGNGAEPPSLDLHVITGQPELRVVGALFEGLVLRGKPGEGVRPAVAHAWETSQDGKIYTFHLRPAAWSDGSPLTARDFVRSWRRFADPTTASEYSSLLNMVRNGSAIRTKRLPPDSLGVSAPDDTTFMVSLENPVGFFLDLCAFEPFYPVPMDTVAKYGDKWATAEHMVGNGPFRLKAWKRNVEIVMEKNPHYWDVARVRQPILVFKPVEDQLTAFNMFLTKELDWIYTLPPSKLESASKRPEFFNRPQFGTYYYIVNCKKPGYDSRDLRLALSYAIDREKIVKRVMKSLVTPATGLVPPTPAYPGPGLNFFDPAKAREHLAKAGYGPGKPPAGLQILFNTAETHKDIATVIQQMWKEVLGVEAELVNYEWKVYLENTKNLNYSSVARASWIGDYPDPITFLELFQSDNGNNRAGYASAAYDKCLQDSWKEADPARRLNGLLACEKLLMEDMPVIPLYYYSLLEMRNPRLRGAEPNPIGYYSWKDVYLEGSAP